MARIEHGDRFGTLSGAATTDGTSSRGDVADPAPEAVGSGRRARGAAGAILAVTGALLLTPAASAGRGEWAPWESLGGDVRSLPECQAQGRTLDCWALSAGQPPEPGSTMAWLHGDRGTWAAWANLGGTLRSGPECVSRGREVHCLAPNVATRNGGVLGHIAYDGQEWGAWEPLSGGAVKQKPACLIGPGQRITCVALAADDTAWWYYPFDGRAWGPATRIDFPAGVASTLRPACEDTARGIACFAVDTNRRLWTIGPGADSTSGDWQPLAENIGEPPHCLASGVELDCFSKSRTGASTAGQLISASFNGESWSQWLGVGDPTVQSQPYCNKLRSGFDCYWTSSDGQLRRRQRDHGVWLPEENLGRPLDPDTGVGINVTARPECLANPGGQRIDCFVQGVDNKLWRRTFD